MQNEHIMRLSIKGSPHMAERRWADDRRQPGTDCHCTVGARLDDRRRVFLTAIFQHRAVSSASFVPVVRANREVKNMHACRNLTIACPRRHRPLPTPRFALAHIFAFITPQAEAQAFAVLVREGLQPLLRVIRYRAGDNAVRQTVSNRKFVGITYCSNLIDRKVKLCRTRQRA